MVGFAKPEPKAQGDWETAGGNDFRVDPKGGETIHP